MEFFEEIEHSKLTVQTLQKRLSIRSLPHYCAAIDTVIKDNGDSGLIYCLWGEFSINREEIRDGLRFTLPNCPNALAWTITTSNDRTVVHCTIDKRSHDADFIDSIKQFIQDWGQGLKNLAEEG